MEQSEFKKLLFKTAFCCMACDGHIDEKEIEEMNYIDKKTSYFEDTDFSSELSEMISELKSKGKQFINDLFNTLTNVDLDLVQELLLLEVTIRIIHSDQKVDENEVRFLKYLRSKLKIYNEIIMDRFGPVDLLFDKEYTGFFETEDQQTEMLSRIKLPKMQELKNIDVSKFNADQ